MAYKMINDYVLVELISNSKVTKSGFILAAVEPPCTGTVISVGPGKMLSSGVIDTHNIEVGDVVVFGKPSLNIPLKDEETQKEYYVMTVGEIYGKKK